MVGEVWGNIRLKLPYLETMPTDFIDIVWEIRLKKPELDWALFAITTWSLWSNRNSVCHGGKSKQAALISREAIAYAKEARQIIEVQTRPSPSRRQTWTPPRRGCYKVNMDEAVFKDMGYCGGGSGHQK